MSFTKIKSSKPWGTVDLLFYTHMLKLKIRFRLYDKNIPNYISIKNICFSVLFQVWFIQETEMKTKFWEIIRKCP